MYVSYCWVGKTHDYQMFKGEFPPGLAWFDDYHVKADLGFLGFANEYACQSLTLPHKKKKKHELSPIQKEENKARARARVFVEHAIAGMKRYRILSERLRLHNVELYNVILGVCAGLWNFYLTH